MLIRRLKKTALPIVALLSLVAGTRTLSADPLTLWYDKPAANWNQALPIGNGRLGAMVFGGVAFEQLQLNDNTLYSGEPGDRDLPLNVASGLDQVRQWLKEGKYAEAHAWVAKHWLGRAQNCYEPLGVLHLEFSGGDEGTNYRRELDLADAVVRTSYVENGVTFTREVFASNPAKAIVIHLHASQPNALNFMVKLDSVHPTAKTVITPDTKELSMSGQVPGFALRRGLSTIKKNGEMWKYPELFGKDGELKPGAKPVLYGDAIGGRGTRFNARVLIQSTDGQLVKGDGLIGVRQADDAVLIVTSGSSFNGYDKSPSREGKDESAEAEANLAAAAKQSFDQLKAAHISDYQSLFNRVTLELGAPTAKSALSTDLRVARYAQGGDEALAALYYQYGRYLLIAGSRPGGQPLNLQGMWNPHVVPPWAGAYTLNINLEMNYWPAEAANLSQCREPYLQMIGELAKNGAKVAHDMYGLPGWVAHHNTTIWRDAQPVDGDAGPAFWNMAGPWLCHDLWDHFEFTGDMNYLRDQAYPVMKGAAEFMSAWLVDDGHGHLVTPVGGSPENKFAYKNAEGHSASAALVPGPTMDIVLVRDLFQNCIAASQLLNVDQPFREKLQAQLALLLPYQIGAKGQLQEWPIDFAETEPAHRHVSHLWGTFPGEQVSLRGTPDLAAATAKSLILRGDQSTGWGLAWRMNLWARLGDGDHARLFFTALVSPERTYPNLFDICPPFQIDGNFGATAGIAETLLQSQGGEINLLPALPQAWPDGKFTGFCARGEYEVSCEWKAGHLVSATIKAAKDSSCHVRYGSKVAVLPMKAEESIVLDQNLEKTK